MTCLVSHKVQIDTWPRRLNIIERKVVPLIGDLCRVAIFYFIDVNPIGVAESAMEKLRIETLDGEYLLTTNTREEVQAAMWKNDEAIFAAAEAHQQALDRFKNPDDYDLSGGWPDSFKAVP